MSQTINYCWFGNNPKSELIQKCIKTWEKHFPDSKIVEWNESNFDVTCCKYVKEAYESKKWAFVSDYCRLWVLYNYGGIYFDTDVELIKHTDIFENNCIGFEKKKMLNPGLVLSAEKGNWFCKEMLAEYETDSFIIDGKHNFRTICDRATDIFVKHGLQLNNRYQIIDGFHVYPTDFFNPLGVGGGELKITKNTVSIHLFAASWIDAEYLANRKLTKKARVYTILKRLFGNRFANFIRRMVNK